MGITIIQLSYLVRAESPVLPPQGWPGRAKGGDG